MELIFPDLTVNQLVALDNQALRDSVIVSNNTSVPLLVFVDKAILASPGTPLSVTTSTTTTTSTSTKSTANSTAISRTETTANTCAAPGASQDPNCYMQNLYAKRKMLNSTFKHDHDPLVVMRELGDLTLVGKYIQYSDRISLTGKAPAPTQPPATPSLSGIVSATSGTPQSAKVGTAFGALQVTVTDAGGSPVSGVPVAFNVVPAPNGAGATLSSAAGTTNGSGVASVVATANTKAGAYSVTGTVTGVASSATFALTNTAGPAAAVSPTTATQTGPIGSTFNLQVTVTDAGSNPVSGGIPCLSP